MRDVGDAVSAWYALGLRRRLWMDFHEVLRIRRPGEQKQLAAATFDS